MTVRPFVFFVFANASPVFGAAVNERIDRLEAKVSEIQMLLNQLNKRTLALQNRPTGEPSNQGCYQARSGDSYWSIARRYKISVTSLERANPGIKPRRIPIGKHLNIPDQPPQSPNFPSKVAAGANGKYTVKKGDILGHISEAHGIRLHQLIAANPGLDPLRLRIGKALNIPGKFQTQAVKTEKSAKTPAEPPPPKTPVEEKKNPYLTAREPEIRRVAKKSPALSVSKPELVIVSKNSRLSEIAGRHQTTVAKLNQLNNVELSPDQMIKTGSQLYIPGR
jgi:LysM repeat protein